jgi:ubiquinone/menaquinone biosynthesis C-methylase UbiE
MGYFSRGMARIVGDAGRVIAVDLQQEMLDITRKRAKRDDVAHRILLRKVEQGNIGVTEQADFVLAFWMVHEVNDTKAFFSQVFSILKPTGTLLLAEPKMHVTRYRFEEIVSYARACGFKITDTPRIRFSRAAALIK